MTTRFRSTLVSAAAAALVLPFLAALAGAAPASASSPRPHEVAMYKVEKHVDLSGEFPDNVLSTTLSCAGGDYALDGMWRVDHVDQATPPDTSDDERDVYVSASYGDSVDPGQWHYRMTNAADGDAQLKLFLTCIHGQVDRAYGHTHGIGLSQQMSATWSNVQPGVQVVFNTSFCQPGQLAVAPGFALSDDLHRMRPVSSFNAVDLLTWRWGFNVTDGGADLVLTQRCLDVRTAAGGSGPHAHKLQVARRPLDNAWVGATLSTGPQELRISCDDGVDGKLYQDYKAMMATFYLDNPGHSWFLGMDPRPKTRAYKFWWDGSGTNGVYLSTLCIRTRTGKQIAP